MVFFNQGTAIVSCIKTSDLLAISYVIQSHHGICGIIEQIENELKPIFKKTSDFEYRLKQFKTIPCPEHCLEIQAVVKLKYFILIMKYSKYMVVSLL